jgi:hypothetical protein
LLCSMSHLSWLRNCLKFWGDGLYVPNHGDVLSQNS